MMRHTLLLLLSLALSACRDDPAPVPASAPESEAQNTPPSAGEPAADEQVDEQADEAPAADEPAQAEADGPPEEPHPYDETADARAQIDAAVAASAQDGKRTLLVFGANWCPWCRRLDYLMKHDAPVMAALGASYHLVHVNVGPRHSDTNAAIDQAYGHPMQNGLPVLVVLDAQGHVEHTQETGALEEGDHHDPAKVLAFLEAHRNQAAH